MNENETTQSSQFVFRRLTESFPFLGQELEGTWWLPILGTILFVGLIYVIWMYVRDGRTIGWFWGAFLALLRLTTYAVIALVFLLPAIQNWEESRTRSRVVLAFDVSTSMQDTRDDLPTPKVPYDKMQTRQDKVLQLLKKDEGKFLKLLQERNPIFAYRWGLGLDEQFLVLDEGKMWDRKEWEKLKTDLPEEERPPGRVMTPENWTEWLIPNLDQQPPENLNAEQSQEFIDRQDRLNRLFAGTNVGQSSLDVLTGELNNMVQGVVIFTDGRSTQNAPRAFVDLAQRAERAQIPVFVIAVGQDRQPVRIEIADARGPDVARPEDPFPISIDVTGEGLPGREVNVYVDVYPPGSKPGEDDPIKTLEKKVTFKPTTRPPRAQAEFPIKPEDFGEVPTAKGEEKPDTSGAKPGSKELAEGEWSFVPRVPKHENEIFPDKEHKRDPVVVKVIKRPTRILLMASAPTRDYQFVRSMLVREMDKKRIELSIYLQALPGRERRTGIVQDVPPNRMLTRFPDKLDTKDTEEPIYNLANYDVIIAFDPDWTEMTREQSNMVEQWVGQQGGGLIIVAGPIHTLELARPGGSALRPGADPKTLQPILDLYPVILKDSRLEKERDTTQPVRLRFPGANPDMEFLDLAENPKANPLNAWAEFFMGPKGNAGDRVMRGFYSFYPVQRTKDGCVTVATFSDPFAQDASGREQPYLVIQPNYGRGKSVWLGSGETWQLRQYREVWHERFWTKLARYASSGSVGQQTRRIIPNMGKTYPVGKFFEIQAQVFGRDLQPLSPDANPKPKVTLRLPTGVAQDEIPTEYEMTPRISPGEWEGWFTARLMVKSPGEYSVDVTLPGSSEVVSNKFTAVAVNPELENTRPDFNAIYDLASEASEVMARLDESTQNRLRTALRKFKVPEPDGADAKKSSAGDKESLRLVFDLKTAEMIPACMLTRQNIARSRGPVEDRWDDGWTMWHDENGEPVEFSYVLAAVVGLLSLEWLTRKLLRLA